MSYLFLAILHDQTNYGSMTPRPGRRAAKRMRWHVRKPFQPTHKHHRNSRGNPGRANRHLFTNKDMRSW